jgi:PAS domain S-box-containing protein
MPAAPLPLDEAARLKALCLYEVLDTEPEAAFDELTRLAADLCGTPIALISLIDAHRQWFKSKVGIDATETTREIAFCSHAILCSDILIVSDTWADQRFATNPLVINAPHIRFYAGMPLVSPEGYNLGTLCVIDVVPRNLSQKQIDALRTLSRQAVTQLELRRKLMQLERITQQSLYSEAALCESETRLRTIADNISVLIWMDDINRQAIFFNQTWLAFTGRSIEQEMGEGWKQSIHPNDLKNLYDTHQAAFNAQIPYTVEYRLKRLDGEYRWMLETGAPLLLVNGTFAGYTGSCVDITDRKQEEEGKQLLQTMTQAIVNSADFHSALAVALEKVCEATHWEFGEAWILNLSKTALECSPAWYSKNDGLAEFRQQSQTFTFPPGVGIPGRVWSSKQPEWHQDVSTESNATYLRAEMALAAGLKAALGIPLLASDEVITVLVFYMFAARPEDQRLIDLIAASTELGLFIQRKQAEEEIRKSLAREQELNQLKSDFLANVSHELRTPLTSILGLSDVLLQQHFGTLNLKQEQYLSLVRNSGEHLLNLINDLLDLAKIEAGKQELYPVVVDVMTLCRSAIEMVEVRAIAKQQQISLKLPLATEFIEVDQQRIVQVLINLLSNAVKFTHPGGSITLSSRLASRSELEADTLPSEIVDLSPSWYGSNSCFLVLGVSDTGVGIPLEKQYLLFRSFQQIDAKNNCKHEGSGLGLALSKKLVELHEGRVSFSSILDVGSTFSIWLPLQEELPDLNT